MFIIVSRTPGYHSETSSQGNMFAELHFKSQRYDVTFSQA